MSNFPDLYRILTQTGLRLPHEIQAAWWRALSQSQWSECQAVYNLFRFYGGEMRVSRERWQEIVWQQLHPQRLIRTIEDLVKQRLLSRKMAVSLEERLFKAMTREGEWKPVKATQEAA